MLLLLTGWLSAQAVAPPTPTRRHTSFAAFGKLPLCFVENRGVYPDEVAYSIQGADKTLFFTKNGITFRLKGRDRGWVVKLEFVGANPNVHPSGEDRRQAVFSYFHGPEENWKTGLPTFARVVYADLWPGIDLVYRGGVNNLKYEFIVAPGPIPHGSGSGIGARRSRPPRMVGSGSRLRSAVFRTSRRWPARKSTGSGCRWRSGSF